VKLIITSARSYLSFHSLGYRGGDGGDNRRGGGYGGETFFCRVQEPNMGKGGDISGPAWAKNKKGIGGGGAGDGTGKHYSSHKDPLTIRERVA